MVKVSFLLIGMLLCFSSQAKLSSKNIKIFKQSCQKFNKGRKNLVRYCACEERNYKWLTPASNWKDFNKIYLAKSESDKPPITDALEPLDLMIYEVRLSCEKNIKFTAPKVISLRNGEKN